MHGLWNHQQKIWKLFSLLKFDKPVYFAAYLNYPWLYGWLHLYYLHLASFFFFFPAVCNCIKQLSKLQPIFESQTLVENHRSRCVMFHKDSFIMDSQFLLASITSEGRCAFIGCCCWIEEHDLCFLNLYKKKKKGLLRYVLFYRSSVW